MRNRRSTDALGCQKEIAAIIIDKKADYILAVKDNQQQLREDITSFVLGALAAGISEALINTAIGIGTSAIAIIMYNLFTGMIDKLTYGIDEIGYSIAQTFSATRK